LIYWKIIILYVFSWLSKIYVYDTCVYIFTFSRMTGIAFLPDIGEHPDQLPTHSETAYGAPLVPVSTECIAHTAWLANDVIHTARYPWDDGYDWKGAKI
jgi:hypothetical protein